MYYDAAPAKSTYPRIQRQRRIISGPHTNYLQDGVSDDQVTVTGVRACGCLWLASRCLLNKVDIIILNLPTVDKWHSSYSEYHCIVNFVV